MRKHDRVRKLFPVMLSPSEAATAIGVRRQNIAEMIADGLRVYRAGENSNRRRIFVRDLARHIRKHWPLDKRSIPHGSA